MNRSKKLTIAGSLVALVAVAAWLAFGFFGIHTLFIDERVSEANPFATSVASGEVAADAPAVAANPAQSDAEHIETEAQAAQPATEVEGADPAADADVTEQAAVPETAAPAETAPTEPQIVTLASGSLVNHAHSGEGTVNVLTDGDQTFLRFEDDFAVDNGPDLNVYLVRGADAEGDTGLFDDDFIDLGDLKGNIGAQNYELPAGVDVSEYDTVVIWCVRFGVAFNAADLA